MHCCAGTLPRFFQLLTTFWFVPMDEASLLTPPADLIARVSASMPRIITIRDSIVNTFCVSQTSQAVKNGGMAFSDNLRRIRQDRNLTQEQLALACGYPGQSRIGNYESKGKSAREPALEEIPVIADALGTSIASLFGREDESQPARFDLATVSSALTWLDFLDAGELFSVDERAEQFTRIYKRIERDGGVVTPEFSDELKLDGAKRHSSAKGKQDAAIRPTTSPRRPRGKQRPAVHGPA